MTTIRYVNDLGNGHSGYLDIGSGVTIATASGQPIQVTTASGVYVSTQPGGTAGDGFGRARVTQPLTLFDSSHRYRDNGLWATSSGSGGTATFNANEGLVELAVTTTSGSQVTRETYKVAAYQPGKSLLFMTTFIMNPPKVNLRQRAGYFGASNGLYIEVDGTTEPAFVERSSVTGSVVNTRVEQSNWNIDPMDGTGPSGLTLDLTKAQILWFDIEWLGLGTVRAGFVINGQFVHCHSFHHANEITSTYITTASLPVRYEITNTGTTASSSKLKQVCSTVISEGGYELAGAPTHIEIPVATPYDLTNVSTYYPVISVRLKAANLDAISILSGLSILGITNNSRYSWDIVIGGTTTGGTWVSAGTNSAIEYNITGTSFSSTGGRIVAGGYTAGSIQGASAIDVLKDQLFKFQLERNGLTNTPLELTLAIATDFAGADVLASLDIEEISR
jgi:hypothetical protein